jgi:hypothetical protein
MNHAVLSDAERTKQTLRSSWDQLIHQLNQAREAIDNPDLHPVPASERNLAEGYRYLLGYLYGAIDRSLANPAYPTIRRAIQPVDKATIDNADAVYLSAEIDGEITFVIKGKALDHRHWRGEKAVNGPRAPQYVIFELASGYAGDSGTIAELKPGTRLNTSTLDSSNLTVDNNGEFEILLAPEKPDGYTGNFMATKRTSHDVEHVGRHLVIRELFYDWEHEDLLDLDLYRVGSEREPPESQNELIAAEQMHQIGQIVNNQMRFWNEFYAVVLETYQDMNGDGKQFMPRNSLNEPNALGIATGGGQSTNVYSGGVYDLKPDQALIIEPSIPELPVYIGFHLSNLWGESHDFANYISSLNGFQLELDDDGIYRWIVAHQDPGVPNWMDTTGLPEGFMSIRFTYPQPPEKVPVLTVTKVNVAEVRNHLPQNTRQVTEQERYQQIRIRQRHVQRRYRQY